MPLHLPPLNALRAFEVAARTGSYVAAAAELGVTPAAVSQQVRALERHFGRRLFTRFNNRTALTDAGQAIFADTARALGEIADMTARLTTGQTRAKLVISVLPSLAEAWFVPRLAAWAETGPLPRIDLRLADDPIDFARDDIDLRLCYGTGLYPDLATLPLFRDEVLPLCAPGLAHRLGDALPDMPDMPDEVLIHTHWGSSFLSHPGWADWFRAHAPGRRADEAKGHRVGSSLLALELARAGLGIALGQRRLAQPHLSSGALVVASEASLPLGHAYAAVSPWVKSRKPDLQRLLRWLQTPPVG